MLFSFAVALAGCFFAGALVAVALAAQARTDGSIARVLYDTEHPAPIRSAR